MQKIFASYELKVLHYELFNVGKTHPILFFKSIAFKNKHVLSLNFV
jgi:hypothetical protein